MSENARGKGRKRALGPIGARQIPSIVQPSGLNVDELDELENLAPEDTAPQMGMEDSSEEQAG
ncbi:hypothetical protein [Pedomonas sp. V897]|uniref:hypothetical protein n=1 Tax=Pedomonas sp. V897 TaxID=3446482 RepID=UPI003EE3CFF9